MRDCYGGDFQIQRADADAVVAMSGKEAGRLGTPGEDSPCGKEINPALQMFICNDLAMRVREAMDLSQPATELLLHRDDRGYDFLAGCADSFQKGRSGPGGNSQG